ncbi:MAG: lipoate protein ligase C-terminal domain-containing protein [Nitrososphaeraceae archaeon]|nr:lipoate protein ligase C-terminal domain-containing protein [Nitrososphaeraceae archaeon]
MLKTAQNIYKTQKLIKILLEYNDQEDSKKIINSIKITGDFFLYPEESLEDLEAQLKGTLLDRYKLKEKIDKCLENSEAFGFDTESMVAAILGCVDGQLN